MTNNNLFSYSLAKIQKLQDMLSHFAHVSITIYSSDGNPITIPSNQNSVCYNKQLLTNSLCHSFCKNMQKQVGDNLLVTSCPYKCSVAIAPLSSSLSSYNDENKSHYFITIIQNNENNFKEVSDNFEEMNFLPTLSLNPKESKFYETAQLITCTFNTIFALMQTDKIDLNISIPESFKKEDLDTLTTREKEILRLVSVGMSNQQISSQLFISEHTVKAHISNILKKLDLCNRTQLAIYKMQSL